MASRCFEPNSDVKGIGAWLDLFANATKILTSTSLFQLENNW